jgi:hypothetical protein
MRNETLDLAIYHEADKETGLCKFNRMVTYGEMKKAMDQALKQAPAMEEGKNWKGEPLSLLDELDYFSFSLKYERDINQDMSTQIPRRINWVACFAVEGGSEGHYIHVELIYSDEKGNQRRELAFLGKTFMGLDHALKVAGVLTRVIY